MKVKAVGKRHDCLKALTFIRRANLVDLIQISFKSHEPDQLLGRGVNRGHFGRGQGRIIIFIRHFMKGVRNAVTVKKPLYVAVRFAEVRQFLAPFHFPICGIGHIKVFGFLFGQFVKKGRVPPCGQK